MMRTRRPFYGTRAVLAGVIVALGLLPAFAAAAQGPVVIRGGWIFTGTT
jgi:hypothetical protein